MERSRRYPKLCSKDKCTACAACYNVCPHKAIDMQEDKFGELFPVVDVNLCVECGLCERICPELGGRGLYRHEPSKIYYAWLKDASCRKQSTSGGVAYAISKAIIRKGGHVWGAAYDQDMELRYVEANALPELKGIQKSKYVQSAVGDAFAVIKKELQAGDLVLFTGTGCHVKGLRSFLGRDYGNLLTLDLVCHGVPGAGVFRKYRKWVESRYGDKMTCYIPRPKRAGDGQELGYYALAKFKHRDDIKLEKRDNSFFVGFQHNLFLRSACFDCQANGKERYSDFTVADFWGLGKLEQFKPYKERTRGISMLALNSERARVFFEEFSSELVYEERTYAEASLTNTQYYRSACPSSRRETFRHDFAEKSWDELADSYMKYTTKEYILYYIKKFTPPICYYMLNYWRNG